MLSLRVHRSVAAWLLLRLTGRFAGLNRRLSVGRLGLLRAEDAPPPALPGPDWVRVRTRLAGICGSDLAVVQARGSPSFSAVTSTPFTLGHEVVADVSEVGPQAQGVRVGERVVVRPALGCAARGIEPACGECAAGRLALCLNVARGALSPGTQTGFCRDTGGGWSEQFVAHPSQLYRPPPELDDREAVLTEPLACAVHAVLRAAPRADDTALVIGCGTMGLLTVVALRACGFRGRLVAAARHEHQRRHALSLGADEALPAPRDGAERCRLWAGALGATAYPAALGKPLVLGGAPCVFDCVATDDSLDDAFRLTAARGRLTLVGMPGVPRGVDWAPLWAKEVTVQGSYCYGTTEHDGRPVDAFARALEVLAAGYGRKLRPLVGPEFPLTDYKRAILTAASPGKSGTVKVVLRPSPEGP
jgi:threonine dehydrogenase-like Zn-dependent dehydrogenase